jgi:hypothetical protein
MTIASAILSVAGVILHSVLKADASDRRESLFLSSLSRAEQQLRKDSQTNGFRYRSETWITTAGGDDSTIDWAIDLGILNRKVSRGDAVIATDRFIFPAGSQLRFQQASSDAVVVVISEPSALGKLNPRRPQVLLVRPVSKFGSTEHSHDTISRELPNRCDSEFISQL